jgi:hypothetical protein
MRHLGNQMDHRADDAHYHHCYSLEATFDPVKKVREWQDHLKWSNGFVIGPPKATEACTQEQLESWGMIGLYDKDLPAAEDDPVFAHSPPRPGINYHSQIGKDRYSLPKGYQPLDFALLDIILSKEPASQTESPTS